MLKLRITKFPNMNLQSLRNLSNCSASPCSFDFNITPFISADLIRIAILMAVGVATLAGLIPALRAPKLTPVEALRPE